MYLDHFGLSEPPFRITPHTDFFFSGGNRGATLDALLYAITHDEGIVKVSGEVGSGKTMLCRVLMERLPESVTIIYLANPSLSRDDILYAIAEELGLIIPADARAATVLRALQEHLIQSHGEGRQVVVLIDEAHAMPAETLEEIRLLSNLESNRHKLLQLVLFGQPELNDILARPDMRQLKERITHNFGLEPLVLSDISSYLDFRLRAAGYKGPNLFGPKAVQMIAKTSLGLTRRINILADKCLLAAYSKSSHQIGTPEVIAAIRDCDFSSSTGQKRAPLSLKPWAVGMALLIAVLTGAGITTLIQSNRNQPSVTPVATTPEIPVSPSLSDQVPISASAPIPTPPEQPEVKTPELKNEIPTANKPTAITPENLPPLPDGIGPLTRQHLEAGTRWLATANDRHWFLQLMSADGGRPDSVETFLKNASKSILDMEQVRVYFVDSNNIRRFGIIYGEFDTLASTNAGLQSLPPVVRAYRPHPRQVSQLR